MNADVSPKSVTNTLLNNFKFKLKERPKYKLNFNHPVKELVWTNILVLNKKAKVTLGHDRFANVNVNTSNSVNQLITILLFQENIKAVKTKLATSVIAYKTLVATGTDVTTLHCMLVYTGTKTRLNLLIGINFIAETSKQMFDLLI